ncbi:MAG: tandem-95 repeat protein, partial [Deltaproteobacteria bacterium]|nr:tandem-95 repeat protein [Deltaproteobacteria bacterium]
AFVGVTDEDTPLNVNLVGADVDGDNLTFTVTAPPQRGVLQGQPPFLLYVPNADANGVDRFEFTVSDGALTATAAGTVTVRAVNDAPVGVPQDVTTNEDTPRALTLGVVDPDPDAFTFAITQAPALGTLTGTAPNLTYVPNLNANGEDGFAYTVRDGAVTSQPVFVRVVVSAVNDAPTTTTVTYATDEDTAVFSPLVANDVDGDNLTFTVVTPPARGTLAQLAPNFVYAPSGDANGTDTLVYTVSDGTLTATGTVTWTIRAVNDGPVPQAVVTRVNQDATVDIVLSAVDVDNEPQLAYVVQDAGTGSLDVTAANVGRTIGNANQGSLRILAVAATTATLRYTPDRNFLGLDNYSFTVTDGRLLGGPAQLGVNVGLVNQPPTAADQNVAAIAEDSAPLAIVLGTQAQNCPAGDPCVATFDPENDALSFSIVTPPRLGVLTGALTGATPIVTYTPNPNANGDDSFVVRVSDGQFTDDATVRLTLTAVNDVPTGTALSLATDEDTALPMRLTGADVETAAAQLVFTVAQAPAFGTLSGTPPSLTYTPNSNANVAVNGVDQFTFTVRDAAGAVSAPVTVDVTVRAENDRPLAGDIVVVGGFPAVRSDTARVTTAEDTPIVLDFANVDPVNGPVLIGDVEAAQLGAQAPALTVTITQAPVRGTLAVTQPPNAGTLPSLTYTPAANVNNTTDRIGFTVSDGALTSVAGFVVVTITPVNDAPVAPALNLAFDEDEVVAVPLSATDIDNSDNDPVNDDTLTFAVAQLPQNGTLFSLQGGVERPVVVDTAVNPTTLRFRPARDFNGLDGFVFTVSDRGVTTTANLAPVLANFTIRAVNDRPVANDSATATDEDTPLPLDLGAFANDVDDAALTFTVTQPARGRVTGVPPQVVYEPRQDLNSVDDGAAGPDRFTYTVSDGRLTATATVAVTVNPVNDVPVPAALAIVTDEDTPVVFTLTATDPDPEAVTFALPARAGAGTLVRVATTPRSVTVRYEPDLNTNGPDSFPFDVNDGRGGAVPGTLVTIDVRAVNDRPVSSSQTVETPEDVPVLIDLANADPQAGPVFVADVENANGALVYVVTRPPTRGTLNGTPPLLTYTPNLNANNSTDCPATGTCLDLFEVTIADGAGGESLVSTPALVRLNVTPLNDAPVAAAQRVRTDEDTARAITLTAGDVDGDQLRFTITRQPRNGSVVVDNPCASATAVGCGNVVIYTPFLNRNGDLLDDFAFTATDNSDTQPVRATSAAVDVSLDVTPVNDPPTGVAGGLVTTDEDQPINLTVEATDVDDTVLSFRVGTPPTRGRLVTGRPIVGTSAEFFYLPFANATGTDTFTFVANDGRADSVPTTFSVRIRASNDDPVAGELRATTSEDTAVLLTLPAVDVDGDPLTFAIATGPVRGELSIPNPQRPDQRLYTPFADDNGADSFTYSVNDGRTAVTGRVDLAIAPVNDAPAAELTSLTVDEDTAGGLVLLGSDVDGDALTFTFTAPNNGTVTGTAPNLTYAPRANFNGSDELSFTVTDTAGLSSTRIAPITVRPVNDAPVFGAGQSIRVVANGATTFTVLAADVDNVLAFAVGAPAPQLGSVALSGARATYTPTVPGNATFPLSDTITFDVTEQGAGGVTIQGSVAVTILGANSPPVIGLSPLNNLPAVQERRASNEFVLTEPGTANVFDADRDDLRFTLLTTPTRGTLRAGARTLTADSTIDFNDERPSTGAPVFPAFVYTAGAIAGAGNVVETLQYRISDGVDAVEGSFEITIENFDDPPVAGAFLFSAGNQLTTAEDPANGFEFNLAASDVDGDAILLQFVGTSGAALLPCGDIPLNGT